MHFHKSPTSMAAPYRSGNPVLIRSSPNPGAACPGKPPQPRLRLSRQPHSRSLSLWPTDSPSRLKRPSTPEASAASLPPLLLRLLPGGGDQLPGGISPTEDSAFHGARERQAKHVPPAPNGCSL